MGKKRNRRSRKLEKRSPERKVDVARVGTSDTGKITLTNRISENHENIGERYSDTQLNEPS